VVFAASGNLLVPMVAHALYDFLVLLYLLKLQRPTY
jgi:membrane protease YdiL (CAAX protease family)